MIKPATLWALCKTCTNSKWIGDVCRALGGQAVELDFGQQQAFNAIQTDSGWMDERIEWEKEANRKRVAEYRKRQREASGKGEDVMDVMITPLRNGHVMPSLPPSVPPSVHTLDNTDVLSSCTKTHTRKRGVPLETLKIICHNQGIPTEYAETFKEAMETQGWEVKTTLANGNIVPSKVNAMNAGVILGTWYRQSKKNAKRATATGKDGIRRGAFAPQTANKRGLD